MSRYQNALIGESGYVGSTLCRQSYFQGRYRSTNINEIRGRSFGTVICAGASGQKWVVNRDPEADRRNIESLIRHLETIDCQRFVLISTVDVFGCPIGVTERTPVVEDELQPYGLHRRHLEKFVESQFPRRLVVRLAGLVGPGLRKNVIFDLLNQNNLDAIDGRGVFQFYPMVNLWYDIQIALAAEVPLVHLTAEPLQVAEAARDGFGRTFEHTLPNPPARYDFQTSHAALFGNDGMYQYSKRESLLAIRAYAQSEPVTLETVSESGR